MLRISLENQNMLFENIVTKTYLIKFSKGKPSILLVKYFFVSKKHTY